MITTLVIKSSPNGKTKGFLSSSCQHQYPDLVIGGCLVKGGLHTGQFLLPQCIVLLRVIQHDAGYVTTALI